MMDSRFIPSDTYRLQQSHRGIPTSIVPPPPPPPHLASTTATTAAIRFIPTPNESHLLPLPPTPSLPLLRLGHTFPVLAPNTTRMSIPPPPPPLPLHHENHSQRNLDLMASTSIYTSMRLPQAQSSARTFVILTESESPRQNRDWCRGCVHYWKQCHHRSDRLSRFPSRSHSLAITGLFTPS